MESLLQSFVTSFFYLRICSLDELISHLFNEKAKLEFFKLYLFMRLCLIKIHQRSVVNILITLIIKQ